MRVRDARGLGRRPRRGRRPAGRRPRRRRAAACRRDSRAPGRPSVSSSSTVEPTSRSDLTPDETISAGMRAQAPRSAETSGGVGKPRWTPPRPPVPMKRMPTACGGGERAADRRRTDRSLDRADREVAWAELARLRREAVELGSGRGRRRSPVEDADRGRDRAGRADGGLARQADLDAVRRGKPCATSVVSSATTARSSGERGLRPRR